MTTVILRRESTITSHSGDSISRPPNAWISAPFVVSAAHAGDDSVRRTAGICAAHGRWRDQVRRRCRRRHNKATAARPASRQSSHAITGFSRSTVSSPFAFTV
jgi:hypothetical protein